MLRLSRVPSRGPSRFDVWPSCSRRSSLRFFACGLPHPIFAGRKSGFYRWPCYSRHRQPLPNDESFIVLAMVDARCSGFVVRLSHSLAGPLFQRLSLGSSKDPATLMGFLVSFAALLRPASIRTIVRFNPPAVRQTRRRPSRFHSGDQPRVLTFAAAALGALSAGYWVFPQGQPRLADASAIKATAALDFWSSSRCLGVAEALDCASRSTRRGDRCLSDRPPTPDRPRVTRLAPGDSIRS